VFLLPDTHAHLDAPVFTGHHEEIIERALAADVDRILAVGSDLASSEAAIALAHRYECIYAAVGIHPHEAREFDGEAEAVRSLLQERKVVAVGEVGLDFYRGSDSRDLQLDAFRAQLQWASECGLPTSIHNRLADAVILQELRTSGVLAVLHCFSGGREMAAEALEGGHYVSFAGNVTYPRAGELRELARDIPEDRILVETDSPVLAPQPHRGSRNEPAYVAFTASTLAGVRGEPVEMFFSAVSANADRIFGWRTV
jgi:TatD DNase family protein